MSVGHIRAVAPASSVAQFSISVTHPRPAGRSLQLTTMRLCDIFISLCALIFLAPLLLITALLIKLEDGGSIFYAQRRIGKGGKEFACYKFRSMHVRSAELLREILETDAQARREWEADHKLRNDPRITRIGKFLRKTSLDELPQLWNVLRGDMSLVGPRPIVQAEVYKYGKSFRSYTSTLPGITGLWQVMGRNDVSYQRRVALDRLFATRRNLRVYFNIIIMTIPAVLMQKGSY